MDELGGTVIERSGSQTQSRVQCLSKGAVSSFLLSRDRLPKLSGTGRSSNSKSFRSRRDIPDLFLSLELLEKVET